MNTKTWTGTIGWIASASLLLTVACSGERSRPPQPVPPGPGATIHLGVASASNRTPSIAARPPYAVIAWTAVGADGRASIYLVTSADNGRTFSMPRRVADAPSSDGRAPGPDVHLGWLRFTADDARMPEIHLVWRDMPAHAFRAVASTDDGRTFAPEPVDDSGWPVALPVQARLKVPPAAIVQRAMHGVKPAHHAAAYDECGTLIVAWDDGASAAGASHVTLRRGLRSPDGSVVILQSIPLSGDGPAAYPAVASLRGGVAAVWETGGAGSQIAVRRVGFQSICQAPVPDNPPVEVDRRASSGG